MSINKSGMGNGVGKKITGSYWQQSKSTLQKMGNQLKLLRFSPCYNVFGLCVRWRFRSRIFQ